MMSENYDIRSNELADCTDYLLHYAYRYREALVKKAMKKDNGVSADIQRVRIREEYDLKDIMLDICRDIQISNKLIVAKKGLINEWYPENSGNSGNPPSDEEMLINWYMYEHDSKSKSGKLINRLNRFLVFRIKHPDMNDGNSWYLGYSDR